jgi:antirestriction protein ArdC
LRYHYRDGQLVSRREDDQGTPLRLPAADLPGGQPCPDAQPLSGAGSETAASGSVSGLAGFGKEAIRQFDAPRWGTDAASQLGLAGANTKPKRKAVTTTHAANARRQVQVFSLAPPYNFKGTKPHRDIQAEITDKIIDAIEKGAVGGSWQMPWHAAASSGLPVNGITGQTYQGINNLYLSFIARSSNWPNVWASFKQWKESGASVKKGEHSSLVVFYKLLEIPVKEYEDEKGEKKHSKTVPLLRYSVVFNITQVDNPPVKLTKPKPSQAQRVENAEGFVSSSGAAIRFGGNRAYFNHAQDYIQIPERASFTGTKTITPTEAYYSTIFHELTHWTGGDARLHRTFGNRFGDSNYAFEELVADIGSSFLCATLGISTELRVDHVQYISQWLTILRGDKKALFTASALASRAIAYLELQKGKGDEE